MRVAIAPRVSSEMQAENGWSFEDQVKRGREWAEREGHAVAEVYFQPAVSAGNADRDELLRIVAEAKANKWDALWIRDLMRFIRLPDDVKHLRTIEFESGRRLYEDGRLITVLTAEGELDVNVRVSLGTYQLAQIRKLTSHGKKARAGAGKPNWSVPPTGYNADGTPRADNANAVRMIFDKYRTGLHGIIDIVDAVNASGYRTNKGRLFTYDTVNAILRNRFYCGFVGYRGMVSVYTQAKRPRASKRDVTWVKGEHAPLIDEETFNACERIRRERSGSRFGKSTKPHHAYLLAHIGQCAHCGAKLRCHTNINGTAIYQCGSTARGLPCSAEHAYIAEPQVLIAVDALMSRLVMPRDIHRRIAEMSAQVEQARDVQAERRKLEAQRNRAKRLFELGDYSEDEYLARRAEIDAQLAQLVVPEPNSAQKAVDIVNDQAAMWKGATTAQRNDILRTLFSQIVVDLDSREVSFTPKQQLEMLWRALKWE